VVGFIGGAGGFVGGEVGFVGVVRFVGGVVGFVGGAGGFVGAGPGCLSNSAFHQSTGVSDGTLFHSPNGVLAKHSPFSYLV
jgi:hypothetical protein